MFALARAHRRSHWRSLCLGLLVCALLSACGGSGHGGGEAPEAPASVSAVIGPAGGTVTGPDGVQIVIPAGALRGNTTIGITRSSAGAPVADPMLATRGTVYEFTPHGIAFEVPVTIRLPLNGMVGPEVWMAGTDTGWSQVETLIAGGFAELQRNRFSWGYMGLSCSSNPNDPPNVDRCFSPQGGTTVVANPANALVRTGFSTGYINPVGSFRLDAAATLTFTTNFNLWPSCSSARVTFYRRQLDKTPNVLETLYDQQNIGLVPGFHGGARGSGGATVLPPVALSHLDRGRHLYASYVECQRGDGFQARYQDSIVINVDVPTPTTTQTIGGTVTGLVGSVVLRNNGADDFTVNGDGAFTFPTPLGTGAPYSVTVGTQPAGQTCTVQNGSGTASTDINNVVVSCAMGTTRSWRGAAPIDSLGPNVQQPQVATDPNGNAFAVWMQHDGTRHNIWANRYAAGGTWGTPQVIETGAGNAEQPQIAVDVAGNATAIWVQQVSGVPRIRSAFYSGGAWGPDQAVEGGSGAANEPQLAVAANGDVMAVWSHIEGQSAIKVARRIGGVWQGEGTASGGIGAAQAPHVAMFPNGVAWVVWQQQSAGFTHIYANRFNEYGGSTADRLVENTSYSLGAPRVAVADSGTAIVTWAQGNGGTSSSDVMTIRYAGGMWQNPEIQSAPNAQNSFDPRIAMTRDAKVMLVWRESHADSIQTWARRRMPDGGWDASAVRLDSAIGGGHGSASTGAVDVAIDTDGNAMALWSHSLDTVSNTDLYAARYDANAMTWSAPQLLENQTDGIGSCSIAMDPSGNAVAVWDQAARIWANLFR